jgi:hypothetical protein
MAGKQLHFINSSAAPPKPPTKWDIFVEVFLKIWTLALLYGVITITAGFLFYVGSRHAWGIQPTFTDCNHPATQKQVSFLDCLHFSVVTITTLGYGDYRPESFGRLVSAVEVLAGIILMGIFVARLVSHHQDRLIKRLVRGQLNTEIQDFREKLADLLKTFTASPPVLTPQQSCPLFYRARGLTNSVARFWRHETREPYMSEVVPLRAAGRLLGELIDVLKAVTDGIGTKKKTDLHKDDFKAARGIAESTLVISTCLTTLIDDHGLRHSHECVTALVKNLRKQLNIRCREVPR